MWASRHEDLVSDRVVAPHVFDHMVVPDRGVVRARCNPPGSAVDACRKPCHDPVYILGDFSRLYGIDISAQILTMVLVSYKPSNDISILQTKLSNREGHEARRAGLETMPLDQYIEGGHRECEPGVEIRPDAMHDLFELAD